MNQLTDLEWIGVAAVLCIVTALIATQPRTQARAKAIRRLREA
jgi:hypothetical protein